MSIYTVSVVTQGKQMIPVLNTLHINAAVYGNHDFGNHNYKILYISTICNQISL